MLCDDSRMSAPISTRAHLPTIIAISILAWAMSNAGHEIIGHGGAFALQGYPTVYVSTSFQVVDSADALSPSQHRIGLAAGTLFNLLLAAVCWLGLRRARSQDGRLLYLLWVLMSLNLFYSASYIMGWFIGPTLDWSLFIVGLEPQLGWKLGLVAGGLMLLVFGFTLSRRHFEIFLGDEVTERRKRMTTLTLTPYVVAIVIKMSAAAVSPNNDKMLVLLGAFGATGFFLIWINLLRFWPLRGAVKASGQSIAIEQSWPWILAGAIALVLYVGVLGRGIGELP